MAEQTDPQKVWTLPNKVSFARVIFFLPFTLAFIASGEYAWALVMMALLGITDWLDGFLARRLNQISDLGKELDPVADRASIMLVSFGLVLAGLLPWYIFALIIMVDVGLVALGTAWFGGYPDTHVSRIGKVRTALLLTAFPLLLFAAALDNQMVLAIALMILWCGLVLHWVAGARYVQQMVQLRARRKTTA